MRRRLTLATIVGTLLVVCGIAAAARQRPAASTRDTIEDAERLMRRGEHMAALRLLQQANTSAGGNCVECLVAMSEAMLGMKALPNALQTAAQAIAAATDQPRLLARAHGVRAEVFQLQAETDPAKHVDAEREFRAAAGFDPENEYMHYGLGVELLKLNRDEEGVAALKRFLEIRDFGSSADAARAMIADPRRGRARFVPDYAATTVDGVRLSPEALKGKVVLYDFWSTTCGPCVAAVPALRNLHKKHAHAPFVLVSVSADADDYVWRRFTVKEQMTWPQVWDRRRELTAKFEIKGQPTYVLVDAEGVEQMRSLGEGFHKSRELQAAVDAQIAKLTGAAPTR
jgi:thioredoxin-like negative regulator of GroEL